MSYADYDVDVNPPRSGSNRRSGVQASSDNRCPCCDAPKWCFILNHGKAVICGRTEVAPEGWEQTGTAKDGRSIFAEIGSRQSQNRYKGDFPESINIKLSPSPKGDTPQWKEVDQDARGIKELQIDYLYPDAQSNEPVGKIVRKQWEDRRHAYNDARDTKLIRPWHWQEPYHPDQGEQGWWSDRGKGLKPWSLYREAEVRDAIASGECQILFSGAGEQAVETFRELGLNSICPAGGEGTSHSQIVNFLKSNTPQVFVISPDEDEAGRKAAVKLQEACDRAKIPAVTINLKNIWSELSCKGDVTNIRQDSGMADSEIVERLLAEIRRAVTERKERDHKANDPDERLKLELQALLQESDPIKKVRKQAEIASHYRISKGEIQGLLNELRQRTSTHVPQSYSLDDFLDLESEGLKWLFSGMLPAGETVILAGVPKSGKTLLAVDAAFAVATGEKFLGENVEKGRVLIISVDESARSTKAKLLKRGFRHIDAENVRVMTRFNIAQMNVLEECLDSFRPHLVIVDSLRRINHGTIISENSAEFADNIYSLKELLSRYNASGMLIHHTAKSSESMGVDKIRGSSAITGAVWGTFQLEHVPKKNSLTKKLVIDPKDPRRILSIFARDAEGQQLQLELELENNSWINKGAVGSSEEWEQECKTLKERILNVLQKNSHTFGLRGKEIIELLGLTLEEGRSVYTQLNRMVDSKLITCKPAPGDKRCNLYSLPNQNTHQPPSDSYQEPEKNPGHSPPTQCVSVDDYSAESYTQQDFPLVINYSSSYSSDSHHPIESTPPDDYSNLDTASTSEIVINFDSQEGGGGTDSTDALVEPVQQTAPLAESTPIYMEEAITPKTEQLSDGLTVKTVSAPKVGDIVVVTDESLSLVNREGSVEMIYNDGEIGIDFGTTFTALKPEQLIVTGSKFKVGQTIQVERGFSQERWVVDAIAKDGRLICKRRVSKGKSESKYFQTNEVKLVE